MTGIGRLHRGVIGEKTGKSDKGEITEVGKSQTKDFKFIL